MKKILISKRNLFPAALLYTTILCLSSGSIAATASPVQNQNPTPFSNMVRKMVLLAEEVLTGAAQGNTDKVTVTTTTPPTNPAQGQTETTQSETPKPAEPAQAQPAEPAKPVYPTQSITQPQLSEPAPSLAEPKFEDPKAEPLKAPVLSDVPDLPTKTDDRGLIQKFFENEVNRQNTVTQAPPPSPAYIQEKIKKKLAKKAEKEKEVTEEEVIKKPSEPVPVARPDTNYKTQRLPSSISSKSYTRENQHLPTAAYTEEYKNILFGSVAEGNLDVIRAMIGEFGDTEVRDSEGNTPLIYAAMAGNLESVVTLSSLGANPNAQNYLGVSPLHAATILARVDLVKFMLSRQADENTSNASGQTPLMLAAEKGYSEIANIFVKTGANLNSKMKDGNTALHLAVINNNTAIANLLVTRGADIDIRNFRGYTPLMLASENGNIQTAALLLNAGADMGKKTMQGQDAITIAKKSGNNELVTILESEDIRRSILADKLLQAKQDKYTPVSDEKPTAQGSKTPLPHSKPKLPKPFFNKEEMKKMGGV